MNRRTFIGSLSAAAVMSRFSWPAQQHRIEKIGVQLYTVRELLKKDFEATLARVAQIGYKEVEFAQYFENLTNLNPAPRKTRQILDADGLAAPSTHVPFKVLS